MLYKENEDKTDERNRQRLYMLVDGKKVYLDPSTTKKCAFGKYDACGFTLRKLYIENDN